mgnify:FL=1
MYNFGRVILMKIGIDIDNTLNDIKNKLTDAAYKYAKEKNKQCKEGVIINDNNDISIYQKLFNFNDEELKYFLGSIRNKIMDNALPRPFCMDTIKQLHNDGHKIYIIASRDNQFYKNSYLQSKIWLENNNIYFDKLIVNVKDKKKVCLKEKIDLLIDANINNCLNVSKVGIQTITIGNNTTFVNGIRNFDNWKQIYNFLNQNKIFKIIPYNEKYKQNVCLFINECMHKFIGRPYKERIDVSNINEYYIKNKGNFWLAIDCKTKEIIGTIAIENRDNKSGILKRFYVNEEYQNNGVGSKLYELLYNYVKEMTQINKIYLACGNVLTKAHIFYKNKGFIQQEKIDIDMHFSEDDDFFIKNINRM